MASNRKMIVKARKDVRRALRDGIKVPEQAIRVLGRIGVDAIHIAMAEQLIDAARKNLATHGNVSNDQKRLASCLGVDLSEMVDRHHRPWAHKPRKQWHRVDFNGWAAEQGVVNPASFHGKCRLLAEVDRINREKAKAAARAKAEIEKRERVDAGSFWNTFQEILRRMTGNVNRNQAIRLADEVGIINPAKSRLANKPRRFLNAIYIRMVQRLKEYRAANKFFVAMFDRWVEDLEKMGLLHMWTLDAVQIRRLGNKLGVGNKELFRNKFKDLNAILIGEQAEQLGVIEDFDRTPFEAPEVPDPAERREFGITGIVDKDDAIAA